MLKIFKLAVKQWFLISCFVFIPLLIRAQNLPSTYIDQRGVIRWTKDQSEVKGFGVNYTVPFAHAYRTAQKMGIDPKEAIDQDVYHFKRLGFDLYRVHVWDTEISDTLGNLVNNEHLDHFDYLLKKLNEANINYVITPIAFWGNGWPEPDTRTSGFSHRYGKGDCLTDLNCISAQERYLFQFMNHVNPYNGVAYKDDPRLIAIEVSNEPHHRGEALEVTKFVKSMVEAIKATGCQKPIFYNASHAVHFSDAYFEGGMNGGTFQWYPTGLGYQQEISGNLLPNVNDYNIPFEGSYKKNKGAKLVYEFDAADVGRSYIYPAMARSFRGAGIQIATHFAYDPTFMAQNNTEYNTHYMNLAYTPAKAISLMICGEVFRNIPMYSDFGVYPANLSFGDFSIDYKQDLAIYNSAEKFIYTNTHTVNPRNPKKLGQIAGVGSSPLVNYQGTGAYFLDKLENGVWRLEVMPDALWVDNPFGRNSPEKIIGLINWKEHQMQVNLSDLKEGFTVHTMDERNISDVLVRGNQFAVSPGTYLIRSTSSKSKQWSPADSFKMGKMADFVAPQSNVDQAYLKHEPVNEVIENQPLTVDLQYVALQKHQNIQLLVLSGWNSKTIAFTETKAYQYQAIIPAEMLKVGNLNYYILVEDSSGTITYPANKRGKPFDWNFYDRAAYSIKVVPSQYPIHLFNAQNDTDKLVREWRRGFQLVPTQNEFEYECQMKLEKLFVVDEENLNAVPIYDYSFKHFIVDEIKSRSQDLKSKTKLVLKGRSLTEAPLKIQIALVMNDGSSFGAMLEVGKELNEYRLNLADLKPVKTVTLPRPYPSFLPYYFKHNLNSSFDLEKVESIQFSIGPDLSEEEKLGALGIGLVGMRLE